MDVEPRELAEVISVTLAICPNCRSRGAATDVAIVSGSAPGRAADTLIVGKSICGRGDTGKERIATIPDRAIPIVRRVVATGRLIKISEKFMPARPRCCHRNLWNEPCPGAWPGGRTTGK